MPTAKISPPPGLSTEPLAAGLWGPGAESPIDGLRSALPAGPLALPISPNATTLPSPETAFQCQQLTSKIFASSDPVEQARLVNELNTLTLSLSAQLTVSKAALDMEVVRSANAQAVNEELRKNLSATEKALATTASTLAMQAANAASAHASLVDERAIAAAVIRELVLKEDALKTATAMLNAQHANLESAYASLREKDQEIYAKNLEIQEKKWAGEAMDARFAEHREMLSKLIVGPARERLSEGGDGETSGSSVELGSPAISAQNAALKEALAEKVDLLMVEEYRSTSLRDLLNQSIVEVGRLKVCLEKAADPAGHPLPENAPPTATKSRSQKLKTQIAGLKEALAEKANLLMIEEHRSANLRDLLNQSIVEVGRLKICLEETVGAARLPLPETQQHYQDTPHTQARQERQRHENLRLANNSPHRGRTKGLGVQFGEEAEDMLVPKTVQANSGEHSVNDTDEGESLTDEENGSALSTATTQVYNEEPRCESTTAITEVCNKSPFLIPTCGEDNFTLSPLCGGDPYMKEEHKNKRSASAPY